MGTKPKKKTVKRTGTRVAKLAAKYLDMDNEQLMMEMHKDCSSMFTIRKSRRRFFDNVRAICASALSQTEPGPKGRK